MSPQERRVLADLLAVAKRLETKHGHLAMVSPELTGFCKSWRPCGPACVHFQATLKESEALLAATELPEPVQMRLEAAG